MRKTKTREEKIANKLAESINDLTVDLDQVGRYLAETIPTISYNRLLLVMEAAVEKKEQNDIRNGQNYLF